MDAIVLHGVRTHNLKNFDLIVPHNKLYVITGVSGSGKSSLAFDTLYAEGQRRYVESLSAYARQFLERMEKPDVDAVSGIPPAIAIQAKNVITNARSTVGTQTEINDYLRLLYARIGRIVCPQCRLEVFSAQPERIAELLEKDYSGREILILFKVHVGRKGKKYLKDALPELERQGFTEYYMNDKIVSAEEVMKMKSVQDFLFICADRFKLDLNNRSRLIDSLELAYRAGRHEIQVVVDHKMMQFSQSCRCFSCGRNFKEPTPNLFSFNSPLGSCPECQGFGRIIKIDWHLVIPDENKSLGEGAIEPWTKPSAEWQLKQMLEFARRKNISVTKPWKQLSENQRKWILRGAAGDDYFSVQDFFDHLEKKTYKMHVRVFLSKYRVFVPCAACSESRLKPEALAVQIDGKNIYQLQTLSIDGLHVFLHQLKFSDSQAGRVEPVFLEIKNRVRFLKEVGLGYLSLARLSRTLSGGEIQRIHLATSLGSGLVDALYVLDEPSVGLHERDNHLLIRLLKELRDLGNTVVVVEHDRTMIEASDEVIDLGPGGGERGGEIFFLGAIPDMARASRSLTGEYLTGKREVKRRQHETPNIPKLIRMHGAREHNLKNIDIPLPLHQLVVITGVSGSGKSTLLYDVLYRNFLRYKGSPVQDVGKVDSVEGFEFVDEMTLVDQTPIGRSPRSNPVTYMKAFDDIRKVFAQTVEARRQGFHPGFFSFNVDGGRCESCKGDGRIKVEMHFLADVFVPCESCQGKRFKSEILEIRFQGKNIDGILSMTIDEAVQFFNKEKMLVQKLSHLSRVGLGYLRLGQSATTLSGGEAQRLKLASEMSSDKGQNTLYLFDEPTTGLHYHDIHYLLEAFDELLERGNSVAVIEHNMEIIRSADAIIDLGPEGGESGGEVIYSGPLHGLLKCHNSYTGIYLKQHLDKIRAHVTSAPI